jgi:Phosphotransferase enzyme family
MEWEQVGGGYTRARKWRVRLEDGSYAFAKEARSTELAVYESVTGGFLPDVHEIRDGVLVIEDLSGANWPPPYPDDVTPLFVALDEIAATAPPPQLRPLTDERRWTAIADDPSALLDLGLCSIAWLERALPVLVEAEARVPQAGSGLVHNDVWADNVCFTDRGAVLVDWAEARIGNPRIDLAFALLSLNVEGAAYLPVFDEPALAAFVMGIIATEAPLPLPDWAQAGSTLRDDQKSDLAVGLRWAAEQLALPPPA